MEKQRPRVCVCVCVCVSVTVPNEWRDGETEHRERWHAGYKERSEGGTSYTSDYWGVGVGEGVSVGARGMMEGVEVCSMRFRKTRKVLFEGVLSCGRGVVQDCFACR